MESHCYTVLLQLVSIQYSERKFSNEFTYGSSITQFFLLTFLGNEQIINAIISYGGVDLNIKDDYMGDTPLMKAIHNGNTDQAKLD